MLQHICNWINKISKPKRHYFCNFIQFHQEFRILNLCHLLVHCGLSGGDFVSDSRLSGLVTSLARLDMLGTVCDLLQGTRLKSSISHQEEEQGEEGRERRVTRTKMRLAR